MQKTTKDLMTPLGIRIKPETKDWLASEAAKQERSINWMVNKLLEDAKAQTQGGKQ